MDNQHREDNTQQRKPTLSAEEFDAALEGAIAALDARDRIIAAAFSRLPQSLKSKVLAYAQGPRKKRGRLKGKQQPETLNRIRDAAVLVFLKYSQPDMVPLLYPNLYGQQHPEAGRKTVNKFLRRNKAAIMHAKKALTREQAEQIAKSLPRDKN